MIPTLVHYKQALLDGLQQNSNPRDRHIKEWTHKDIQVKRLIRDMVRDGFIRVEYETIRGTVKRHLRPCVSHIIEPAEF